MAWYIITYDIQDSTRSTKMDKWLKDKADIHIQLSTWAIESNKTPPQLFDEIAIKERFIDTEDKLFICRLTRRAELNDVIKGGGIGQLIGWDFT